MSSTTKTLVAIVVIVVIAGGFYYWQAHMTSPGTVAVESATSTESVSGTSGPGTLPTQGTSNAALNADLSALDAQLSGLGTDTANVNASMNDQPVTQSNL
ncbi:MAG: hypothetical protein B7X04_03305 [Parcubacteria group bacterium 21-54-25]|nr:MAG: hypothetical protein B7X04_03305 [Parcubacteria group bacterium 21-54-25]HQU08043.1 hypothetical protein [Candidatus Paceibacterota bacterium]